MHRLRQMRCLRMLEEKKSCKGGPGFDRIETVAKMDAQRFHTSLNSEPFYKKAFHSRWHHTPAEHTLKMKVDFE